MSVSSATPSSPPDAPATGRGKGRGIFALWSGTPLYIRIIGALILGILTGVALGQDAASLAMPAKLVLRLLGALAPPLILVAVIHALMTADIQGKTAGKLIGLLMLNTLVAICIGLLVANVIQPGKWNRLEPIPATPAGASGTDKMDVVGQMLDNIPKSILGPLADDGKVVGVIFLAVAFGFALRTLRNRPLNTVEDVVEVALASLIRVLHWIIEIVPFAVFGIVASIVGTKGFDAFKSLGMFVIAVLVALFLQALYYLARVRISSWVNPVELVKNCRDALVMAFSTASSTITMPVTYACLKEKVGLREKSAGMGSLVGANFNNDGTALYEAMSALFVAQMLGMNLTFEQQIMVVITSVIASVGAAGIPEAGLVTMTLVFTAVGLPVEYIAILLTVDWFLDRCRTAINVMGDMNVSCMLDGKVREEKSPTEVGAIPAVV